MRTCDTIKLGELVDRLMAITDMDEAREEWDKLSKIEQALVKTAVNDMRQGI